MLKPRTANLTGSLLLLASILSCSVNCQIEMTGPVENKTGTNESRSRVFSPRMDYDEWTPLGRGDPLKNDPTFDYVPPVLDRVQYWLDSHTTEPSAKRDILVLGVTAKKTSPKIPEQFLKFVDGPKFTKSPDQQYRNEHILHRNDFTGSTGAEPPKILRNTNFRNGMGDYRNHNRIQNVPASYYPSPFYNQKPKPYTMMLPPPVVPKPIDAAQPTFTPQKEKMASYADQNQQFSTQTEEGPIQDERLSYNSPHMNSFSQPHPPPRSVQSSSRPPPKHQLSQIEGLNSVYTPPVQTTREKFQSVTTPSVSFEKSNLVYHSTQTISGGWLANGGPSSEVNQVTWQTPFNAQEQFDTSGDHQAAGSSNHDVVIGQNANIIVDGENSENEEVVVGKKGSPPQENSLVQTPASSGNLVQSSMLSTDDNDSGNIVVGKPSSTDSDAQMHIVVANAGPVDPGFEGSKRKEPVSVIMPTNYVEIANVTHLESNTESTNVTYDDRRLDSLPATQAEQNIQISKPLSQPNAITNPPAPIPQMNHMNYHPVHMSQVNQMNPMSQMNPMNQMNQMMQMNQMNQMAHAHQINQINQVPVRSVFPGPNAQPLIHLSQGSGHAMMPGQMGNGMRRPPGSLPSMPPQKMFNEHQHHHQVVPGMQHSSPTMHSTPGPEVGMTGVTDSESFRVKSPPNLQMNSMQSVNGAAAPPQVPFLPTAASSVSQPETATSSLDLVTDYIKNQSPLAHLLNNDINRVTRTSTPAAPTTTASSLTTDPIFSHYKQPAKPIRGPMYLIIQGHSKVKTYKPSVNRHGVPVEYNEIREASTERPSKLEQLINENTKSRIGDKSVQEKPSFVEEEKEKDKPRRKRIEEQDLLSLVENNLSGFTVRPEFQVEEHRGANSLTTIEINN
ncbi:uncharacterized protein LOC124407020 [Diprion similis]|uniref:uncharacterized protein LOC124407020 n=1 Tax=Diprion similis TaxID=362088 RepID=UPI001EF75737|nr:uncharacterized protein LOC124407020 [Diprion similis]XP_046738754.1 uncharacterized protein LOC124407020 [Diprion similis]